jgi:hypothetical protein
MSRRALPSGFAWVLALALVLVRSLVPAGYMPGLVDGRLSIVLCDSHAAAHQHHQHHHADGDCAYAQSASPALLATIDLSPPGQQFLSWTVRRFDPGLPISEPPRYSSARGPPARFGI